MAIRGTMRPMSNTPLLQWTMADRLTKARDLTGRTQKEFAEIVGVSKSTVANYENPRWDKRRLPVVLHRWADVATQLVQERGFPDEEITYDWITTGRVPGMARRADDTPTQGVDSSGWNVPERVYANA